MQISTAKNTNSFSDPTLLEVWVGKVSRAISKIQMEARCTSAPAVSSPRIDRSNLDSLYRLARLLAASDSQAEDLVVETYRSIAHSERDDGAPSRSALFEALRQVFQANREKYEHTENRTERLRLRDWDPIRSLIYEEDPIVRCMIFLRYCENLPLTEIGRITGSPVDTVKSRLVNFRSSEQLGRSLSLSLS